MNCLFPKKQVLLPIICVALLLSACQIPYRKLDHFPERAILVKDEQPHFKNSLEWWYFTGFLQDTVTQKWYGIEYVFFHYTPSAVRDYLMVNVAVSDPNTQQFYYDYEAKPQSKFLRPDSLPFNLSMKHKKQDDWLMEGGVGNYQLSATMRNHPVGLQLKTSPTKAVLMHSGVGYENYGDVAKAGYYSYPRLKTAGTLLIDGEEIPVRGELWYDRQWNCANVLSTRAGWDWMALQFDDQRDELMIYQVRGGKVGEPVVGGTYYSPDGENVHLNNEDIQLKPVRWWHSPNTNFSYPIAWSVRVPKLDLDVTVNAQIDQQELTLKFFLPGLKLNYWEGMCEVKGTRNDQPMTGSAYLEITKGTKGKVSSPENLTER